MASFTGIVHPSMTGGMSGVILGEISSTCKSVVVGLDFGTAFSGIAYAYKGDPQSIRCGAPTAVGDQMKVPTSLLRLDSPDPVTGKMWFFGNEAEDKYNEALTNFVHQDGVANIKLPVQLFKRFKMVLKDKTSGFEELKAQSVAGEQISLMELISLSLEFLKEFAMEQIRTGYGAALDINSVEDVCWVVTVPAIWNDFGKAFMRKASFKAGMIGSEQSDNLTFVLEPEGASLAVQAGAMLAGGSNSLFNEKK